MTPGSSLLADVNAAALPVPLLIIRCRWDAYVPLERAVPSVPTTAARVVTVCAGHTSVLLWLPAWWEVRRFLGGGDPPRTRGVF